MRELAFPQVPGLHEDGISRGAPRGTPLYLPHQNARVRIYCRAFDAHLIHKGCKGCRPDIQESNLPEQTT